jgi:phosphotransferase system HPr (HPr) family protein
MTKVPEEEGGEWISRGVTVTNSQGLHVRPATKIVTLANQYEAEITIRQAGTISLDGKIIATDPDNFDTVDAKSLWNILTLAMTQGTYLLISARGADSEEAVQALIELINSGFGDD